MFNSFFGLGDLFGLYSGSSVVAAVGTTLYKLGGDGSYYSNFGSLSPVVARFLVSLVLLGLALVVLMVVSWWKIFEKTGRPGWPAIVPIYNIVVILQIVGMSPWLVLVSFVPFVGPIAFFVVSIFMNIKLAKAFGQTEGFVVGLILLPVVFVPMLAFGKPRFMGTVPLSHPVTSPVSQTSPPNAV